MIAPAIGLTEQFGVTCDAGGGSGKYNPIGFQIEVKTDNAAPFGSVNVTLNTQFRYAMLPTLAYSFRIDWGDGSYDIVTCGVGVAPVIATYVWVTGAVTTVGTYVPTGFFAAVPYVLHTYPTAGTYTVTITPTNSAGLLSPICITDPRQTADRGSDALKVISLKRWGNVGFTKFTNAFQGCSNLLITATDFATANLSACTHFGSAFERTAIPSFPSFSLPSATNINFMFFQAFNLVNAPVFVLTPGCQMNSTFRQCTSLVTFPAIDLSGVTKLQNVCDGCSALVNGPTGPASAADNFARSFASCPLLKSSFAALAPAAMTGASDFALNSDLNDPDSATNRTNYNALLVAWTGWSAGAPGPAGLALQAGVTIHFGTSKYDTADVDAVAARAWLIGTKGWTITDGGAFP